MAALMILVFVWDAPSAVKFEGMGHAIIDGQYQLSQTQMTIKGVNFQIQLTGRRVWARVDYPTGAYAEYEDIYLQQPRGWVLVPMRIVDGKFVAKDGSPPLGVTPAMRLFFPRY